MPESRTRVNQFLLALPAANGSDRGRQMSSPRNVRRLRGARRGPSARRESYFSVVYARAGDGTSERRTRENTVLLTVRRDDRK